jgi:hypothetical protein
MGIPTKHGKCKVCPPEAPVQPLIGGMCKNHYWEDNRAKNALKNAGKPKAQPKPINKLSKKRQVEELRYKVLRIEFLGKKENQICPITKEKTTDIHHKKGRIGDLLLDTRYWVALSRRGHKFVEENPEWARKNGFSLNRLSKE